VRGRGGRVQEKAAVLSSRLRKTAWTSWGGKITSGVFNFSPCSWKDFVVNEKKETKEGAARANLGDYRKRNTKKVNGKNRELKKSSTFVNRLGRGESAADWQKKKENNVYQIILEQRKK